MSFRTFLTVAVCLVPFTACAPEPSAPESTEADVTQEDALQGDTVFVVTRQDFRKCAYPMCGGVFVKAVNKAKTKCFDGTSQEECYVAEIDQAALGLTGTQADEVRFATLSGDVLLSGELTALEQGDYAKLLVHKAFEAETGHDATGTFYLVEPSGITCIKAPCPNFTARKLNSTSSKLVTDIDLDNLGLTQAEIDATMTAVFETHIVVSGKIANVSTPVGTEKRLTVSELFGTVEPAAPQLCLDHGACGAGSHCDFSQCLSGCAEGQICPAVCYGACVPGDAPVCPGGGAICQSFCGGPDIEIPEGCPIPACDCPMPQPGSCFQACGGAAPDKACYCDDACLDYGDCCEDYASQCQ